MKILVALTFLFIGLVAHASAASAPQGNVNGYEAGQSALNAALNRSFNQQRGAAKNVILFVGDGMSIATVTAARIYEGQSMGLSGEEHNLAFDDFTFAGLSRTYNTDAQTPDSAGTMTAMVTGVKTRMGVLGVGPEVARDDCAGQAANELMSIATMAELAGKRTGMISTARITHATPAALYAHSVNRDWESDVDLSPEAVAEGCQDIASKLVNYVERVTATFGKPIDGPELTWGGGAANFLPAGLEDTFGFTGRRADGRNLVQEWLDQSPKASFVSDRQGLMALTQDQLPSLGLFAASHLSYDADRIKKSADEPSLAAMTSKAIELLDNEQGFFLMVESGRIDHAHHAGSAAGALSDTVALSEAVAVARELTSDKDTLIIVTADHSHVMTMAGYPKRGNPILGKVVPVGSDEVVLADDGLPYTTLSYGNGRGFANVENETNADARYGLPIAAGRHDHSKIDTEAFGYHQEALVPLKAETHGGDDVAIYASGPGAHLLSGSLEQNVIFHVMHYMAGLPEAGSYQR